MQRCRLIMLNKIGIRPWTIINVDGKQARRTGTSSGLGELFEPVNVLQIMELKLVTGQVMGPLAC